MHKMSACRLAFSISVLFLAPAVLGQEAAEKPTRPGPECEPGYCISKILYLPRFSEPSQLQNLVNTFRVMADVTKIHSTPTEHTISLEGTAEQIAIIEKLASVLESLRSSGGQNPSSVLVYELKGSEPEATVSKRPGANIRCDVSTCLIKVLYLPGFARTDELQDMVNMFRTITDITRIVPDPSSHTISLRGTAEQLAIAERLVSVMESLRASGGNHRSSVFIYSLKGSMPPPAASVPVPCEVTTCFIKALYLPDFSTTQFAEFVNKVRTTAQMSRTSPSPSRHVLVVRGTSEQVALAERLVHE